MGPKRKRPPSGVLILTTGRTDQIAHDLVLADLRPWVIFDRVYCFAGHLMSVLRAKQAVPVPGAVKMGREPYPPKSNRNKPICFSPYLAVRQLVDTTMASR
jgi:hypothetical protein